MAHGHPRAARSDRGLAPVKSPQNVHRVGRPLDLDEAEERAIQAAVLGDTLNLRLLSALAAGVARPELPEVLHISADRSDTAIEALAAAGIVHHDADTGWILTAKAWMRFGRLLVALPPGAPSLPPPRLTQMAPLPESVTSLAHDLAYRFSSTFSPETVTRYVVESYLLLSQRAQVRTHLAPLTARYAADRLTALATAQGLVLRGTPEVLFVCVQNAGRSQLAAAYLKHLVGDSVHVRTAGSAPASEVHPRIAESLAEIGVPLSDDFPKPLTEEVVQAADYVITMGCGDACPVYPGRRYLDWDLDDPLELDDDGLRRVRDQIRDHVSGLLVELGFNQHVSR